MIVCSDLCFYDPFLLTHSKDAAKLARFHAKWHRDLFLPTEKERAIDWPMLKTTGRGRFVGVMLHIWSPRGGWWGEGDEKFFVDGISDAIAKGLKGSSSTA